MLEVLAVVLVDVVVVGELVVEVLEVVDDEGGEVARYAAAPPAISIITITIIAIVLEIAKRLFLWSNNNLRQEQSIKTLRLRRH